MTTFDITDGRGDVPGYARAVSYDLGPVFSYVSSTSGTTWVNTGIAYDYALGGAPFISATNDQRPVQRVTAPFKKDQFDNGAEPGEQSLSGWWLRSQGSFHAGSGIKFYDPSAGEIVFYRFNDSQGINVWTKGEVTLLRQVASASVTTATTPVNLRQQQKLRSITYGTTDAVLLQDGYKASKIDSASVVTNFISYVNGTDDPIYSMCDNGTNAYWITNHLQAAVNKCHFLSKPLTGSTATAETVMFYATGLTVTNAVIQYVKERLIACVNNAIYELPVTATALPTPVYTHPSTTVVYTSIAASGAAIYVSLYNGNKSSILKFTLNQSTGALPTLSSAVTCAEFAAGEMVHSMFFYGGYLAIGTSLGVRVAAINETDGSMVYGPLLIENTILQPTYQFSGWKNFIFCATGVAGQPGVLRLDLGNEISQTTSLAIRESLRFSYANDAQFDTATTNNITTSVAMIGNTNRVAFATTNDTGTGAVYIQDATVLRTTGYLTTGKIRYSTLEPKNFKKVRARGDYTYGDLAIQTIDLNGTAYDIVTYNSTTGSPEVITSSPAGAQEYISYKFIFSRDGLDSTQGPVFKGYQAKATIATPRQRLIKHSVYCFDIETDHNNQVIGREGLAYARITKLEEIESNGDIVTWQDLNTGESRQVVIEQTSFTQITPPDKSFKGYGGIIDITVRTV